MSSKHDLYLDWCSFQAARYAVEHWHYSKKMPIGKLIKVGVWEKRGFIGCVIFGRGANNNLLRPYGLVETEGCELVRIALSDHTNYVSKIISLSLRLLKKHFTSMRLVISYADPEQNHLGIVYQAGNWLYLGKTNPAVEYIVNGKRMHGRSLRLCFGTSVGHMQAGLFYKYRYAYPLDREMRERLQPMSLSYPKCPTSIDSDALVIPG